METITAVRASQAFAATRQATIERLNAELSTQLLPDYNAAIEDITRTFQAAIEAANAAPTEVARETLTRVADRHKMARLLGLQLRQQNFIKSLQKSLRLEMQQAVEDFEGTLFVEVESKDGRDRPVRKVKFQDGSVAKVPSKLFIDYSQFHSV